MSEKLPSLFDFDDEDFFPQREEKKPEPVEEQQVKGANNTPGEKGQVTGGSEEKEEALAEEKSLDNRPDEILGIQEREREELLPRDYSKPRLELPDGADTDDFGTSSSAQAFDKQAGDAYYQRKAAAFTFEPRKETRIATEAVLRQSALRETNDTEPGVSMADMQSETGNEEESTGDEKVIIEPLPEWNLNKNYYTIGEVAQLFEVNVSHIRFWTTEFKMKTRTTRKGDRLYTPAQIGELRLIHHLVKIKKYTLKGAKEILKSGNVQLERKLNLKEELQKLYQALSALKDSL